ncbi:MAG: MFS transporter [Verrucomicrobiales bacterium]
MGSKHIEHQADEGDAKKGARFPAGLNQAFLFSTFNALSFQIVLGSPMVLYAKNLGASSTVLGIITGMMPLLVIFQIPAANYIGRIGYKRFVFAGWGTRVVFIFAIAVIPLLAAFLTKTTLLVLVLFLLFMFNLFRGISSCAWLPWISSLVPGPIRGKYLAYEQAYVGVASCGAFLIAAAVLGVNPDPWQFALSFLISGLAGMASLWYLKRIPDVPVPVEVRTSNTPIPWMALAKYRPFSKLLIVNLGWSAAYGGVNAFAASFLKTQANLPESTVLYLSSVFFLGGLSSLIFAPHIDKSGSKPVISFSCILWLVICLGWVLVAGKVMEPTYFLILILQFFMGMGAALVATANVRLAMVISPEMGRNHFFALYSVVANVSLGLSPVIWGLLMDIFGKRNFETFDLDWNRFTFFFAGSGVMFIVTWILSLRLEEPAAGNIETLLRDALVKSPQKMFLKLWPR